MRFDIILILYFGVDLISCSGSPIENLSILATKIITPLLKFLPSHLKSIHEHLEILRGMEPGELAGFNVLHR